MQQIVALSTAESELYRLLKLATALHSTVTILIGEGKVSSAGRVKHVDIKFQWLKMTIIEKHFLIRYMTSALTYSDGLTKSLAAPGFQQFVRMCLERKIIGNETIRGRTFVTINKSDLLTSMSMTQAEIESRIPQDSNLSFGSRVCPQIRDVDCAHLGFAPYLTLICCPKVRFVYPSNWPFWLCASVYRPEPFLMQPEP